MEASGGVHSRGGRWHRTRVRRTISALLTALLAAVGVVTVPPTAAAAADLVVTAAGAFDSEIGCPGDWQPDCQAAQLSKRANDGIYSATFTIPAGDYEYKIAVGGNWDENYGLGGVPGGANATLSLATETAVTFYYNPVTHLFATSADGPIITVPGSFQNELGCPGDWSPDCMASWLTDPDRDGVYTYATSDIPTGSYEAKVAHGLSWDENYGVDGAPGGANYSFSTTSGKQVTFSYVLATHVLTITANDPPLPGTGQQQAFWVDRQTLAWPKSLLINGSGVTEESWKLYHSPTAGITAQDGVVTGGTTVDLTLDPAGLSAAQLAAHPELAGYLALRPTGLDAGAIDALMREQLMVAQFRADGTASALTGIQLPSVLDDLYATAAGQRTLGVSWAGAIPTITVWAPTAQQVAVELSGSADGTAPTGLTVPTTRNDDGTWSVTGDPSWKNVRYLLQIQVYVPSLAQIVTNTVTDPYSAALTVNSTHSVAVDLNDPAYRPQLWTDTPSPIVANPVDRAIYELHIRDFSINDQKVPAQARGTYSAFTYDSDGTEHLRQLAQAGMNTVHLLPSFDIASIPELRGEQSTPQCDLPSLPPDSDQQQACVGAAAGSDGYNWGYDPWHYSTPDGSYAVNADGGDRVAEFRSMVGALHQDGLQVVLDQVFNHTAASGQDPKSVLDQVVPGYYQRLDKIGTVYTSTCCQNVATEHAMAQKLMVDSVVLWAKDYKVDGFRFDLMGHASKANMLAIRGALDKLTMANDGIDGKAIYLYGEGWNFGEVANNALFEQATQGQLGGTGIGTFTDRLRDAVNGGSPVSADTLQDQGFGNGLGTDPSGVGTIPADQQLAELAKDSDLVRLGLAGNLRSYSFLTSSGQTLRGDQIDYNGVPAGYADQPDEVVNYVDAHDNATLFDMLTLKLPVATSMADRVRMNTLSLATVTLAQGVSFWHAGTDLLRSKSLDHNSYDSGDWFNSLDWTGQDNGFGRGLPPARDNSSEWPVQGPLLANPALKPAPADIATASDQADDLLRLRSSTPLFRLGDADLIQQKLTFPGSGPDATPGVIVMSIDDTVGADVDPALNGALVVYNASPTSTTQTMPALAGRNFTLSPIQAQGTDPVVKTTSWDAATGAVTVPARSVAVLVSPASAVPNSSVTLTADPASQVYGSGKRVTLTATVSSSVSPVTGTVEFRAGDTVLGTAAVTNGTASFKLPAKTPAGALDVVAHYNGGGGAPAADSAPVHITIDKATSSTRLVGTGGFLGLPALLLSTVHLDNGQLAKGTVEIRDNGTLIATVPLRAGIATYLTKRSNPRDKHSYTATFVPADPANISGSTSNTLKIPR